jgi:Flp pilus assembly protein TadG
VIPGPDRGQATVEVALILPVLATLLLAVVQVGLVVRDQILVTHAAREAARSAAVDPSPGAARAAAVDGSGLPAARLQVAVSDRDGPAGRVRVAVAYRTPTDVPLVGRLVGELTLRAEATMRVEGG